MSKVERLNARVAKLLTAAVNEVLEVVKETVSEYQEKTARTLRENESLKRRIQELQDNVQRPKPGESRPQQFNCSVSLLCTNRRLFTQELRR